MVEIVASLTGCAVIVIVTMVAVIVIVVVVKVLVCAAATTSMVVVGEALVIDVLADAEIIEVGVIVIGWKFVSTVSCSVDGSSDAAVDSFMDTFADVMLGVLPAIGVEALAGVIAYDFATAMTALEFPVSAPLEEFKLNC